mgnify:CR=1 FL=1
MCSLLFLLTMQKKKKAKTVYEEKEKKRKKKRKKKEKKKKKKKRKKKNLSSHRLTDNDFLSDWLRKQSLVKYSQMNNAAFPYAICKKRYFFLS